MNEQHDDFLGGVAKIALGIFFGALLVWMAMEWRARYELRQLEQQTAAEAARFEEQIRAQQEREAKRRRDLQLLREDQTRKQIARQTQQAERWREFNETNKRKEAAWREFYKPASKCLSEVRVECGNAYMRARQEFERRYAAGEI